MGKVLSETAKNALKLTIDEKMTLHRILEATEKVSDILSMSNPDNAVKAIKDDTKLPEHIKEYLNNDILPLLEKVSNKV